MTKASTSTRRWCGDPDHDDLDRVGHGRLPCPREHDPARVQVPGAEVDRRRERAVDVDPGGAPLRAPRGDQRDPRPVNVRPIDAPVRLRVAGRAAGPRARVRHAPGPAPGQRRAVVLHDRGVERARLAPGAPVAGRVAGPHLHAVGVPDREAVPARPRSGSDGDLAAPRAAVDAPADLVAADGRRRVLGRRPAGHGAEPAAAVGRERADPQPRLADRGGDGVDDDRDAGRVRGPADRAGDVDEVGPAAGARRDGDR